MNHLRLLMAAGVLAFSAEVRAAVIYSTFGPGDTFNINNGGWPVGFATPQSGAIAAARFSSNENYTLTSIRVATYYVVEPNNFVVSLNSDNNGSPGSALATFSNTAFPLLGIVTVAPGGTVNLTSGSTYWVVLSAAASPTAGGWYPNDQNLVGNWAQSFTDQSGWFQQNNALTPAFDVNGNVTTAGNVPEPSAIALTALGVAGLLLRRRR